MNAASSGGLRSRTGRIGNVRDLRRAGALLAKHVGLPRDPRITVGYVPWKGQDNGIDIFFMHGDFKIARWAVHGRHKRSWSQLEYELVRGIGFWLDEHRRRTSPKEQRPAFFSSSGEREALVAWYGIEAGGALATEDERRSRVAFIAFVVVVGVLAALTIVTSLTR